MGTSWENLKVFISSTFRDLDHLLWSLDNKLKTITNSTYTTGEELISDYFGLVAAGRSGIPTVELGKILGIGEDLLFMLSENLQNFIVEQNGYLIFSHLELKHSVYACLGKPTMQQHHQSLAKYLIERGYHDARTLDELPYQLQCGKNYAQLLHVLSDLEFIEGKCHHGMIVGLYKDLQFAVTKSEVAIPDDLVVEIAPEVHIGKKILTLFKKIIDCDIHLLKAHPQCIFQSFWNMGYWHDSPELENYYQVEGAKPWEQTQKIYSVVELWRQQKQKNTNFTWLKSTRPLPHRLDSGVLKRLHGHSSTIISANLSMDGHYAVSSSGDQTVNSDYTVRVWDTAGTMICCLKPGIGITTQTALSPDNSKLAIGIAYDGKVELWDIHSETRLHEWQEHNGKVSAIKFSPDGTLIVSGSQDNTLCIFSVQEGTVLHKITEHTKQVTSVEFSADGSKIISGSLDDSICVWDSKIGGLFFKFEGLNSGGVKKVRFTADGSKIIAVSMDNFIRIWDAQTGAGIATCALNNAPMIGTVAISPDGSKIAFNSFDNVIHVWSIPTGNFLYRLEGHDKDISTLEFSNSKLISGSYDCSVYIWDVATDPISFQLKTKTQKIVKQKLSPDGSKILLVFSDDTVEVRDTKWGNLLCNFDEQQTTISDVQFSHDSSQVICAYGGIAKLWNAEDGSIISTYKEDQDSIIHVNFNDEDSKIISSTSNEKVHIWDREGHILKTLSGCNNSNLWGKGKSLAFSKDARQILGGTCVWDIETGKRHQLQGPTYTLVFDEDFNRYILYAPRHDKIENPKFKEQEYQFTAGSFNADGSKIFISWSNGENFIYDAKTYETIDVFVTPDRKGDMSDRVEQIFPSCDGKKVYLKSSTFIQEWDSTTKTVRLLEGNSDVENIAANVDVFKYMVRSLDSITIVTTKVDHKDVAYFPHPLQEVTISYDDSVFGYHGDYLYILKLQRPKDSVS